MLSSVAKAMRCSGSTSGSKRLLMALVIRKVVER
jgi:hypothetical protein